MRHVDTILGSFFTESTSVARPIPNIIYSKKGWYCRHCEKPYR